MKKIIRNLSLVLILLVMTVIFYLSDEQGSQSSGTSNGVTNFVLSVFNPQYKNADQALKAELLETYSPYIRKAAHFSIFALLAFFMAIFFSTFNGAVNFGIKSLAGSSIYAALDEVHQIFVPGRAFEFGDIAIDIMGALIGVLTVKLVYKIITKKRYKNLKDN